MTDKDLSEKRSEGRLLTRLSCRIKMVSADNPNTTEGQLIECITRDISFVGICLQINDEVPTSSKCMLKINNNHTGIEYNHICEVAWCREIDAGYQIGLHIYEHLCDVTDWKNMVVSLLAG